MTIKDFTMNLNSSENKFLTKLMLIVLFQYILMGGLSLAIISIIIVVGVFFILINTSIQSRRL